MDRWKGSGHYQILLGAVGLVLMAAVIITNLDLVIELEPTRWGIPLRWALAAWSLPAAILLILGGRRRLFGKAPKHTGKVVGYAFFVFAFTCVMTGADVVGNAVASYQYPEDALSQFYARLGWADWLSTIWLLAAGTVLMLLGAPKLHASTSGDTRSDTTDSASAEARP